MQYFMQTTGEEVCKKTYSVTGRPRAIGFSLPTGFILSTPPIRLQHSFLNMFWNKLHQGKIPGKLCNNIVAI